ncbi:prostaglandin E receptor 1a (subtype EP1) [Hoplias malabaricus]|uniref:prostaglandin E receptor 1a (subtype EP1) n=1 Tax=Hoplias malabaricus TaxID=27720 RepID=UPI0034622C55
MDLASLSVDSTSEHFELRKSSNWSHLTLALLNANTSTVSERFLSGPMAAALSMSLGVASNVAALLILLKSYAGLRRRSKATFLLLAAALVMTDLAGHVVAGGLVLRLYLSRVGDGVPQPDALCQLLGGSMVFFGLCSLFLGGIMAAERCLGVTRPLLHASAVSGRRVKLALSGVWLAALTVALMPVASLGSYNYQHPGTWCFITVLPHSDLDPDTDSATRERDRAFALLFSTLGLGSLAVSLVFNTVSGVSLLCGRLRNKQHRGTKHSTRSHDIEMVVQLLGIMVTSCICWSPLLIFSFLSVMRSYEDSAGEDIAAYRTLMITGVRLASWNQILDPWVYILLRKAVLRRIYIVTKCPANPSNVRRWTSDSVHSSKRNSVSNRV